MSLNAIIIINLHDLSYNDQPNSFIKNHFKVIVCYPSSGVAIYKIVSFQL
jgi:hypothetical protein